MFASASPPGPDDRSRRLRDGVLHAAHAAPNSALSPKPFKGIAKAMGADEKNISPKAEAL